MRSSRTCNTQVAKAVLALAGTSHRALAENMGFPPSRFSEVLAGSRTASLRFRTVFFQSLQAELDAALFPEKESAR